MEKLECVECGAEKPLPPHCGKPMHVETIGASDWLVCWMGPECGKQALPQHCGKPMKPAAG